MILLLYVLIQSDIPVSDIPSCDVMINVNSIQSAVVRRTINANQSFCINADPTTPSYDGKRLSFIFNELSGATPILFYNSSSGSSTNWYRVDGDPGHGGASLAQYSGFLYINATERIELIISYTTFDSMCENMFLSSNPLELMSMLELIGRINCYFNGIRGRQLLEVYSNNSKCGCIAAIIPKDPVMLSTYSYPRKFNNDQGSISFVKYKCMEYNSRSGNRITVEADPQSKYFTNEWINVSQPQFYGKFEGEFDNYYWNLLVFFWGMFEVIFMFFLAILFREKIRNCWCDFHIKCYPIKYAHMKTKSYSYSDDRIIEAPIYDPKEQNNNYSLQ